MKGDEQRTVLFGKRTAQKDCPQICLRGELDSLLARAVLVCAYAGQYGDTEIAGGAADIVRVVKALVRSEASQVPPDVENILGMDMEELRYVSQHPKTELGLEHYFPDENTDMTTALLNLLRADIRRAERRCVAAGGDNPANTGIQTVLNRLSSAAYILMMESGWRG